MNEQGPRGVEVRPSGRWGNHGTVVQPFGAWNWTDTLAGTSSVARWIEAPISLLLIIELQRKIHLKKKKRNQKVNFSLQISFHTFGKVGTAFQFEQVNRKFPWKRAVWSLKRLTAKWAQLTKSCESLIYEISSVITWNQLCWTRVGNFFLFCFNWVTGPICRLVTSSCRRHLIVWILKS